MTAALCSTLWAVRVCEQLAWASFRGLSVALQRKSSGEPSVGDVCVALSGVRTAVGVRTTGVAVDVVCGEVLITGGSAAVGELRVATSIVSVIRCVV
jgi:hypothetical protein